MRRTASSPPASLLHVQLGYEPFRWLMVFGEAELGYTSTRYAPSPPSSRGYAIWALGAGLRATVKPTDRFGIYLQGDIGGMKADSDVLRTYGFREADLLNVYYGGMLGLEWYQIDPHLALATSAGIRRTTGFDGSRLVAEAARSWLGGVSLRYTF